MCRLLSERLGVVEGHAEGPLGSEYMWVDGISGRLGGSGFLGHGLRLQLVSFQITKLEYQCFGVEGDAFKRLPRGVTIVQDSFPAGPGGEATLWRTPFA